MKLFISIVAFAVTVISAHANTKNSDTKNLHLLKSSFLAEQSAPGVGTVISQYLNLKNALAADNSKGAAAAGAELQKALVSLGTSTMSATQKKAYNDIAPDAEENAEHISKNAGNIKHQREHFQVLSDDIYDLVKSFGTQQTLYKDYCPMAKAAWLSEAKDIKNPYLGAKMPTCGEVKETIKQ